MSGVPDLTPASAAPSIPDVAYVISALKGAANWHAEQGRPYSEQTDRDAIAFIVALSNCNRDLLEALHHAYEALHAYNGLAYERDGKSASDRIRAAIAKASPADGATSTSERSGT